MSRAKRAAGDAGAAAAAGDVAAFGAGAGKAAAEPVGATATATAGAGAEAAASLLASGASAAQRRDVALQALYAAVQAAPWAHDFFALLRRIECLQPEAPRLGQALRPSQEAIRLGQEAELEFAPAALATFGFEGQGAAPRLGVRFFGLLGSQGPMPLHLTEHIRERQRSRNDPTAARFLDIFHHRMLTLFYRAWSQGQPTAQQDRPGDDRFAAWLGATFGLEVETRSSGPLPDGHMPKGPLPQTARVFQAGLLGTRSRHPEGLVKLLRQHFGVPVRIESHVAHRLQIESADRSRLGYARNRPERGAAIGAALGASANAGSRVPDRQYKFRIVLGPLSLAAYLGFLPGAAAWLQLREWVRQYVGLDLFWDVQLELTEAERPEPRLGRRVALGVTSWLGGSQRARQAVASGADQLDVPAAGYRRRDLRLRPDTCFLSIRGRHGVTHA